MRTHDECKAEIFRRSAKRIEERKKIRTKILFTLLPLILLSVTASFVFLPKIIGGNDSFFAPEHNQNQQDGDSENPLIRVESSSMQLYNAIYDEEKHYTVSEFLRKNMNQDRGEPEPNQDKFLGSANGQVPNGNTESNYTPQDATSSIMGGSTEYIIRISDEAGKEKLYRLLGNRLTDNETNRYTILTAEERETLLKLLGIGE